MKPVSPSLRAKARRIKLLLLDVDGVLTDGGIYIDGQGKESKRFDVRDGQGVTLLGQGGIKVGLISGRSSNAVRVRARELGISIVHQGVRDKTLIYERIRRKARLGDKEIAYVGDDIGDLAILRRVGLAIAVRDCWVGLRPIVDYVTRARGGQGAVREVSELLLSSKGLWSFVLKRYNRR